MEELIKLTEHARELVNLLKVRLGKIEGEKADVKRYREGNEMKAKELISLEASLKKREAAVKDIEDIATAKKRIDEAAKKNEADLGILLKKQGEFEIEKKAWAEEKANKEALLKKQNEELAAAQNKLNKDRENYRKEVIDEVTKNIAKK